ncbi:neural Wiskott-Aldrich syndrome protein-like [Penaeus chinensis]|uniref:neural Wiskott-Aldrich syndrome protein-like n=1 Tax=Penaeus chinensis TaxID=139456 RepID=UPI001FB6F689|nr:neural Wiskott-Aldrich syndrome protein-like [Penaeus chinensis]
MLQQGACRPYQRPPTSLGPLCPQPKSEGVGEAAAASQAECREAGASGGSPGEESGEGPTRRACRMVEEIRLEENVSKKDWNQSLSGNCGVWLAPARADGEQRSAGDYSTSPAKSSESSKAHTLRKKRIPPHPHTTPPLRRTAPPNNRRHPPRPPQPSRSRPPAFAPPRVTHPPTRNPPTTPSTQHELLPNGLAPLPPPHFRLPHLPPRPPPPRCLRLLEPLLLLPSLQRPAFHNFQRPPLDPPNLAKGGGLPAPEPGSFRHPPHRSSDPAISQLTSPIIKLDPRNRIILLTGSNSTPLCRSTPTIPALLNGYNSKAPTTTSTRLRTQSYQQIQPHRPNS